MSKSQPKPIAPGETFAFRIPSTTSQETIDYLNFWKVKQGNKFSRDAANLFIEAVEKQMKQQNTPKSTNGLNQNEFLIELPNDLTPDQRAWLSNPTSKVLLGNMISQLLFGGGNSLDLSNLFKAPVEQAVTTEPVATHQHTDVPNITQAPVIEPTDTTTPSQALSDRDRTMMLSNMGLNEDDL